MTGKSIEMGSYLYRKKIEMDPNGGMYRAINVLGGHENLHDQYRTYGISLKDRKSHTYISGGTESGKSELIKSLVYQHLIYEPNATQIIIDPEGELAEEIARFNCASRDDVLFVDSSDTMNIMDSGGDPQVVIKVLSELLGEDERLTSRMKRVLHHCITVLILRPNSTLEDLINFMDDDENKKLIAYAKHLPRGRTKRFIQDKLNGINASVREGIESRIDGLLNADMVEDFVCGCSTFDLKEAIEDKKLIIFDLSDDDSYAVGRMIIAKIVSLLRDRNKIEARNTVYLYVDEAHEYLTPEVSFILKRLRKRGGFLTLATQGRMGDRAIDEAIGENTGLTFQGKAYGRGEFIINNRGDEITLQCNQLDKSCYISDTEWSNRLEKKKRLEYSTPKLLKNADVPPKLDSDQQAVIDALKEYRKLTAQGFLDLGIKNGKTQVNKLLRTMKGDHGMIVEHEQERNSRGYNTSSIYTLPY